MVFMGKHILPQNLAFIFSPVNTNSCYSQRNRWWASVLQPRESVSIVLCRIGKQHPLEETQIQSDSWPFKRQATTWSSFKQAEQVRRQEQNQPWIMRLQSYTHWEQWMTRGLELHFHFLECMLPPRPLLVPFLIHPTGKLPPPQENGHVVMLVF